MKQLPEEIKFKAGRADVSALATTVGHYAVRYLASDTSSYQDRLMGSVARDLSVKLARIMLRKTVQSFSLTKTEYLCVMAIHARHDNYTLNQFAQVIHPKII